MELREPELKTIAKTALEKAQNFRITNADQFRIAEQTVKDLLAHNKRVEEFFEPMKLAAHKAHKTVCMRETEAKVDSAIRCLKNGMAQYQIEEQRRLEAEAQAAQEKAEAAAQAMRDEEFRKLYGAGQRKAAQELKAQPLEIVPVEVAKPVTTDVRLVKVWDFEITEPLKLPRKYLCANEAEIRKTVRALGKEANIGGVRVFQTCGGKEIK